MGPGKQSDIGGDDERDADGSSPAAIEAHVAAVDAVALGALDGLQVQLRQPAVDRRPG